MSQLPNVPPRGPKTPPSLPLHESTTHGRLPGLVLAAMGVVFGDIGTSPLYALKECIAPGHGAQPTPDNLMGILSLIVWALTMVVTVKYLMFVMRAENHGEGGILALLALVPDSQSPRGTRIGWAAALVIFGAALLYGDGIITPAISVLSAIEGLDVATSAFHSVIVPLTCIILLALFSVQRKGTARIGQVFGWVMMVWFLTIGGIGLVHIVGHPQILLAVDPRYGIHFLIHHGWHGFLVLGAVVLVITGGEALYADMGHFGPRPIRIAWFAAVMPALLLNYFGQAANVIAHPEAAESPFFAMFPSFLIYPMVVLSTMATIIASQALISGSYSLTRQAIQLGYFPRLKIVHTSGDSEGQIFVPFVNTALAVACIGLVLLFKESTALASAYGIAVTGTMSITSVIYFVVITKKWKWPLWKAIPLVATFLAFDLAFVSANLLKFMSGGWLPIVIASAIFVVMTTWKGGRTLLGRALSERTLPIDAFLLDVAQSSPHRVPGTAVVMSSNSEGVPTVLLHNWKHNQVLHARIILLSILSEPFPYVALNNRLEVVNLGQGFHRVIARYGFMQSPHVPEVLGQVASEFGLPYDPSRTSFFLGRETLLTSGEGPMMHWRKSLFSLLLRNARPATLYFHIPPDRVVELGLQIDL